MTQEEQREQVIQNLADMMRTTPFTSELKVVKKPKGIKLIIEVTQEQMNAVLKNVAKKRQTTTNYANFKSLHLITAAQASAKVISTLEIGTPADGEHGGRARRTTG